MHARSAEPSALRCTASVLKRFAALGTAACASALRGMLPALAASFVCTSLITTAASWSKAGSMPMMGLALSSGGGVSSPSADVRTMRPDDIMYYLRKARRDEIRIATLGEARTRASRF
jgi:hypothetical protein